MYADAASEIGVARGGFQISILGQETAPAMQGEKGNLMIKGLHYSAAAAAGRTLIAKIFPGRLNVIRAESRRGDMPPP